MIANGSLAGEKCPLNFNRNGIRVKQKAFTLLEVLLAIGLVIFLSGVIGWNMRQAIEKKKFKSELARLESRLQTVQKMAISMQADWRAVLRKESSGWVFESVCEELEDRRGASFSLDALEIFLNGKPTHLLTFDFFANGHMDPQGKIVFQRDQERQEWQTSEIFLIAEGKKLGPLHPND